MKHPTSRSWTPEQDERLRELLDAGATALRAAAALKRTIGAVQTRARNLGTRFKPKREARGAWMSASPKLDKSAGNSNDM